ncbi:uncharacterized protein LOC130820517 [Amaranthus tricolor]|uniref:uncharacterized protein LOC130820517 n=1 Tax=Amaranthus tricolor TaxID=29722 RepID=UPI00258557E4|nr:uncharacterized protein LOC130820517 [Amaranthus tricolor]
MEGLINSCCVICVCMGDCFLIGRDVHANSTSKPDDDLQILIMTSLKTKMEELKSIGDDVKLKVIKLREEEGMKPSKAVQDWLIRLDATQKQVYEIFPEFDDKMDHKISPISISRSEAASKLKKKLTKLMNEFNDMKRKGEFPLLAN